MSAIDDLITDRTSSDVSAVTTLLNKWYAGHWSATDYVTWQNGMKGAWNYTDLNRINEALQEVNGFAMLQQGRVDTAREAANVPDNGVFHLPYQPRELTFKYDYAEGDSVEQGQEADLILAYQTIGEWCGDYLTATQKAKIPTDIGFMTYTKANDMESVILDFQNALAQMTNDYINRVTIWSDLTAQQTGTAITGGSYV